MLSRWPIRKKLLAASVLLAAIVICLSIGGFRGVYAYRALVKGVSRRAAELPLASELARHVSDMRVTLGEIDYGLRYPAAAPGKEISRIALRQQFDIDLLRVRQTLGEYKERLEENRRLPSPGVRIQSEEEWRNVELIEGSIDLIDGLKQADWALFEVGSVSTLEEEVNRLHKLSMQLPVFLHDRMSSFADDVRVRYRTWIFLTWATTISVLLMMAVTGQQFYRWVFRPLNTLIQGSRLVAAGNFGHRIQLDSQDEMRELSDAMNHMTQRFQQIRDDLDRQVRERTREVVQSERLASVGFLAAGVAHEINNPLASIALCAESLEDRMHDVFMADDTLPDGQSNEDIAVIRNYLRMIQDEAFRCKGITEGLLDFSRIGDVEKANVDLNEIVQDVIEMVSHIGHYKEKQIVYYSTQPVIAPVNSQEFKQVVLNLVTNALDSLDRGGVVHVSLNLVDGYARLSVKDDGCGMTPEVRQHLFEPFFTRRRDGQGTGLGLSITYRIVTDHGGRIEAKSDGAGTGSELIVLVPLAEQDSKETRHQYQQVA